MKIPDSQGLAAKQVEQFESQRPFALQSPNVSPPDRLTSSPPPMDVGASTLAMRRVASPPAYGELVGRWNLPPSPPYPGARAGPGAAAYVGDVTTLDIAAAGEAEDGFVEYRITL